MVIPCLYSIRVTTYLKDKWVWCVSCEHSWCWATPIYIHKWSPRAMFSRWASTRARRDTVDWRCPPISAPGAKGSVACGGGGAMARGPGARTCPPRTCCPAKMVARERATARTVLTQAWDTFATRSSAGMDCSVLAQRNWLVWASCHSVTWTNWIQICSVALANQKGKQKIN